MKQLLSSGIFTQTSSLLVSPSCRTDGAPFCAVSLRKKYPGRLNRTFDMSNTSCKDTGGDLVKFIFGQQIPGRLSDTMVALCLV